MAPKIELLTEPIQLGEGPHWDATTQSLYFVDIRGKSIHRYHPSTQKHTKATIGNLPISIIIPIENSPQKFLISQGRQLATIKWDGINDQILELTKVCEVDDDEETLDNRFNDGKCDPTGRLWIGTMGNGPIYHQTKKGGLFTLNRNKIVQKHLSNVSLANGIAWNKELNKMYFIDSPKRTIDEYDIDIKHGSLSDCKSIFSLEKHNIPGLPDGMTIDTAGNLWVAIYDGSRIIKIDPRKPETLLQTIEMPAKQVTSVTFGGNNLDELYVTSASINADGVELPPPYHGATYRITNTGSRGYPGVKVKL